MAWNTGPNSPGEELTTLSTSEVAVCLLQGLGEVAGTLAQLIEQPRILDGDNGLCGEVLQQRDLLVCKRLHLLSVDRDCTHQDVVLKQGQGNERPSPGYFDNGNASRIAF